MNPQSLPPYGEPYRHAYGPPNQPTGRQVTRSRRRTSHGLHVVLTVCTGGLWGLVWAGMTLWHKFGPRQRSVTTWS